MGLFVDTTGSNVTIAELGITLTHPTTNYDLSGQFSAEDIKSAISLTTYIRNGTLNWKKTSGGAIEVSTDYDADFLDIEYEHTGNGLEADRTATISDLVDIEKDDAGIVSNARTINFEGNVSVTDEGSNKVTIGVGNSSNVIGCVITFPFFGVGTTTDKWLSLDGSSASSNETAYILPYACVADHFTYSNANDGSNTDIKIYKNGVLCNTIEIRNKRYYYKTNCGVISFSAGDRVSTYLVDIEGTKPKDPEIVIGIRITDVTRGEGGA